MKPTGPTTALTSAKPRVGRYGGHWHPQSIARWLTLHYVVSTAALLCVAGGFLYWTLSRSLDNARFGMLAGKVRVLEALVKSPEKEAVLASEVEHEAVESQPFKYYFRILNDRAAVLHETPDMSRLFPPALFPAPLEASADPRSGIQRRTWSDRTLLVVSVRLPIGADARQMRTLQAALDVSAGAALLADYRNKLLLVLLAGIAFATLAGAWIARRGVRPVVEITQAARHITASQLHARIVGEEWPAELADLAEAFDAMLDRLEDSFGRLSQFAGDLAHEMRAPITNLRGEAEVALSRPRTAAEYQQILASSLEEFDRLSRMIDGLLFLARADHPQNVMEKVVFDARKELDAVCDFHDAQASEAAVQVRCEGSGQITGDPMLFRRAVSNLLSNAIRHTPAGGRVVLQLRQVDGQDVELTVADNGSGIAADDLPRVFDRFYRVDAPASRARSGAGLGLAIVQSIARLHGATVQVTSQVGNGTVFTINFPGPSETMPHPNVTEL